MISALTPRPAREGKMQNANCRSKTDGLPIGKAGGFLLEKTSARAALRVATFAFCLLHFAFVAAYTVPPMAPAEVVTTPLAAKHYAEHPERYRFAKPEDLPKDLVWESDESEPEYASPEAKRGGTLRIGISGYPNTLRHYGPNANHGYRGYIYDCQSFGPVGFHPNSRKHIPELALAWAVSKDRRTCYLRLDPNARFSDGQPITADDYFFTLFFCTHEYTRDPFCQDYYANEIESVTKYDDHTLAITIPRVKPDPFITACFPPIPRHFYREFGPDFVSRYNRRFEPTPGPYVILPGDDVVDRSITLTRVDNWWGDKRKYLRHRFNPDKLVLNVVRDQEKSAKIFLSGDLDITLLPKTAKYWYGFKKEVPVAKGWVERDIFYNDAPRPTFGLYLNTSQPPLDNLDVRLGLAYAADFQRILHAFLRSDYDRLNQYAQGYGEYTDTTIKARPYDPDTAVAHFKKAGYDRRGPDGILMNKAGERLSFSILIDSDGERKKYMAALIDSAKKAGVEFTAKALERTTMFKQTKAKSFQIVYWAWLPTGYWPDFRQGFHSENARNPDGSIKTETNNITALSDPEMDRMIDEFRNLTDEDKMVALSKKMQRRLHDLAVYIPGQCDPGYRLARWRWVKFPADFDAKPANDPFDFMVLWIDEDTKRETEAARAAGTSFGVRTNIHDKYRAE